LEIIVHRGTNEVGGSCIEVKSSKSRIILDVGMPLFDANRRPYDSFQLRRMTKAELLTKGIIPAVPGLFEEGVAPDAILLSHAHLDHTGLLNYSQSTIPVYASSGTSKMMLAGGMYAMQVEIPRERFREIKPETPVTIGDFTITGFSVDHSIFGCLAFLIEAEGKSILYTGDLRLHGRKPGMNRRLIEVLKDKTIDVMLMEGTHYGLPDGNDVNEYELEDEIVDLVRASKGIVLASFSPQHVDRLVTFIRAAKKTGRTFVADVYTAFIMHLLRYEISLPQPKSGGLVRVYVPNSLRKSAKRSGKAKQIDRFLDSEITMTEIKKNPDQFLMVFRASMLDDFGGTLPSETKCLYSRWTGYLEQSDWKMMSQKLDEVSGTLSEVHTSGHILSKDITTFVNDIAPKTIIPVHTFEPHRFQEQFNNVQLLGDGETYLVN